MNVYAFVPALELKFTIMQIEDTGEKKQPREHRSWKFKPINLKVTGDITPVRLTVVLGSIKANYPVIPGIDANSGWSSVSLSETTTQ